MRALPWAGEGRAWGRAASSSHGDRTRRLLGGGAAVFARSLVLIPLVMASVVACASPNAETRPTASTPTVRWLTDEGTGFALGVLELPVADWPSRVEGASVTVVRRKADDAEHRLGTLVVNPGGPGLSGVEMVRTAQLYFPQEILDRFDIVSWDPRGVGETTPTIDCIDDYDAVFDGLDTTPDDAAESAAARRARRGVRTWLRGAHGRRAPARQHEPGGSGHRCDPASARRGQDLRTSASATAPSSARCGRRCTPTRCGPSCSTARSIRRPTVPGGACSEPSGSSRRSSGTSPPAAATRRVPSTTAATPRAPSTR